MSDPETEQRIRDAIAHLTAAQEDEALAGLIAAWGASRSRALAAAIEQLDAHVVARRPPPPTGGTNKHEAWMAALDAASEGSISMLMDSVVDTQPRSSLAKLRRLGARPPDPRISSRVWAWLRDVPIPGSAGRQFYVECARVLIAVDDDRFDDAIANAVVADHTTGSYTKARLRKVGARTAFKALQDLEAHVQGRGPHPEPSPNVAAALSELETAIRAAIGRAAGEIASEQSLLEAVYADPGADEPRQVYADFLLERGDPRGELIALQIARARTSAGPTRRERSLLVKYGDAICGELEPWILKSGRQFRRGFLAACRYKDDRLSKPSLGLAGWATVEEVDVGPHVYVSGVFELLTQPHMRALRAVHGITDSELFKLCRHDRPLPIERIHLRRCPQIDALIRPLRRSKALPMLRQLDLRDLPNRDGLARIRAELGDDIEVL